MSKIDIFIKNLNFFFSCHAGLRSFWSLGLWPLVIHDPRMGTASASCVAKIK